MTAWLVSSSSPRNVDELNFTSRDSDGAIRWRDVTPQKIDYYHAHQMLGRTYAFELLDLINNPKASMITLLAALPVSLYDKDIL